MSKAPDSAWWPIKYDHSRLTWPTDRAEVFVAERNIRLVIEDWRKEAVPAPYLFVTIVVPEIYRAVCFETDLELRAFLLRVNDVGAEAFREWKARR